MCGGLLVVLWCAFVCAGCKHPDSNWARHEAHTSCHWCQWHVIIAVPALQNHISCLPLIDGDCQERLGTAVEVIHVMWGDAMHMRLMATARRALIIPYA